MNKPKILTHWELLVILVVAAALAVWYLLPREAGGSVTVTLGGESLGEYSLGEDRQVTLQGRHGLTLVLVIEDGEARVEEADCPDHICQRHAPISGAGESIVCLPAQLTIAVKGGSGHGPDAVTG